MRHLFLFLILSVSVSVSAEDLVILSTNDTHSNIDSDKDGTGGILPRKAIIDSVRNAEKNVILVDAGDIVQGTLYFKYFHGDVEYPLFNMMDYDIRILGNHEFDNGIEELAKYWKDVKGARLSANYDFKGTPAEGLFDPYTIKKIGKHKIGFVGINIDPESLIQTDKYGAMKYRDAIKTANETAAYLKNKKKCDLVVAVTHIGYNELDKLSDVKLAEQSRDIDIIIGGHSHTFVDPKNEKSDPHWIMNADGKPVLVTQTGKYGKNVGYIKINLDKIDSRDFNYDLIPVTDRFPEKSYDKKMQAFLKPYRHLVDSINSNKIGISLADMPNGLKTGAFVNWTADMALDVAKSISASQKESDSSFPEIDLAIMNVGGIRQPMYKGAITEGQILATFPFSNKLNIIRIKGSDIIDAMKVASRKGGEAISRNMRVVADSTGNLKNVIIDGTAMDPNKIYTVTTIDYLAEGNDDLRSLANNTVVWKSPEELSALVLRYIKNLNSLGLPVNPDSTPRFIFNAVQ